MALIIGALPHSEWQLLTPLLEAMGWEPEQVLAPEGWYSDAGLAFELSGDDVCVLLHSRPERCIANALDQGVELRAAAALWQVSAEHLLNVYRQRRTQAILVDVKSACETPRSLLDWLTGNQPAFAARASGITQQSLRLGYVEDSDSLEHNLNLLVATQAVRQSSSIQRLLANIEASTVPAARSASNNAPQVTVPRIDVMSTQLQLQNAQKRRFEARWEGKLEGLKEAHKAELQVWEARVEGLGREREGYQTKVEHLSSELERFAREKHEELLELRQTLTEAQQRASQVVAELAERDERLGEKDEHLSEYAQTVARYEQKLAYQTSEMEKFALDKHKDVVSFREKLIQAEREVRNQAPLVDALMREREQLHAKVASLSTSWLSWFIFPARWVYLSAKKVGKLLWGRSHRRAVRVIEQSDLFDATWYARQYPDVIESGANPADHYARFGAFEGRDPGPRFSSTKYLKRNRDIAKSGINPLVHYELHGKHEGRSAR